jgi:signal transduction histidine kinase/ActR/RegA family two-component response regulator
VEGMITHLDRRNKRMKLSIQQQMKHQALVSEVMQVLGEEDEEGPGLPLAEEVAFEEKENTIDPASAGQIGSVLVVDDHNEVREPLVEWLGRLGIEADGAESLKQALDRLEEKSYGLALIDLNLSGEDGLGLVEALERVAADTWVAVMSTPELIAQRSEELANLGVIEAFVKPLDLEEIREVLVKLGQGERPGSLGLQVVEDKREEVQSSFQRLAETMRSGAPLVGRFEVGLKQLVPSAQAEEGVVFRLDPDSQRVSIVARVGELRLNREAVDGLVESPVKDVIREGIPVFETFVSRSAQRRFSKLSALLPFESCLGIPIPAGGEVQYALFLFHREPEAFSRYRLRDAQATAMLFSVALESQALEQRIRAVAPFLLSGQLAAGFGHEVFNKMSGLEIQLRNLQTDCQRLELDRDALDTGELGRAMDQILDVALDMKDAVTLFRELVRAEQEERVDVNGMVQRAVLLLRPIARQERVRIEPNLAPDLPPVVGNAVRLQQVFVNVMLNAVQQTALKMKQWPEGRGRLKITTAHEPEEARPIRVRFADNGPGIHRQLWEHIFTLGFSTRPGGTGLGLFIAKSLVESMGGAIGVERSMVPAGTIFRVELPAVRSKE